MKTIEKIERKIEFFEKHGIPPWLSEEEIEYLDREGWDLLPTSFRENARYCVRCGGAWTYGYTDGAGAWHKGDCPDSPQCFPTRRCFTCDPWGSFPGEETDEEDKEIVAAREYRHQHSHAGFFQAAADAANRLWKK